jgi:hypothetical protein
MASNRAPPTDVFQCASNEIVNSLNPAKGCTAVKISIFLLENISVAGCVVSHRSVRPKWFNSELPFIRFSVSSGVHIIFFPR